MLLFCRQRIERMKRKHFFLLCQQPLPTAGKNKPLRGVKNTDGGEAPGKGETDRSSRSTTKSERSKKNIDCFWKHMEYNTMNDMRLVIKLGVCHPVGVTAKRYG